MSDESKLHAEADKGHRASSLLNNEIYKEAVGKVRQGIHDAWGKSPLRDTEGQHELRLMLKLLDDLEGNIVSVANTGKLALKQLEQQRTLKERAMEAAKGLIAKVS